MENYTTIQQKRDQKAKPHLEQYAPVWLVNEKYVPEDEVLQFNVVFRHKDYGWVNRKYRYDGFNDILYYRGQLILDEQEIDKIQEQEPYIATTIPDIINSYGG